MEKKSQKTINKAQTHTEGRQRRHGERQDHDTYSHSFNIESELTPNMLLQHFTVSDVICQKQRQNNTQQK